MKIEEKQLKAIAEIKKFYPISTFEIEQLNSFVALLLNFNQEYNLIGKSTVEDIWHRHILDSAQLLRDVEDKNLILGDFGSGAGFPGIVLSILGVKEVHLIEKSFRKCQFLNLAKEMLYKQALDNKLLVNKIIIHQKKVADIKDIKFDIITSRAFAPLKELIEFIKPFFHQKTYCLFLKGKNFIDEIKLAKESYQFYHSPRSSLTSDEGMVIFINNIKN